MHSMGLHSALAIKRQRKRREELKKSRDRRYSSQSTESGLEGSSLGSPGSMIGSTDRLRSGRKKTTSSPDLLDSKMVPPIGMLHIGIVFLVLGLFLIGSGMIPDDYTSWDQFSNWWNELVCTGLFAFAIGVFLIGLNHYLSQQEEDELNAYVERQLTRSKSGKRYIKDEETGCLKTKREHRAKDTIVTIEPEDQELAESVFIPNLKSPPPIKVSSPKSDLEKILEEDASERDEYYYNDIEHFNKNTMKNGSTSPNNRAASEARDLVTTRYYNTPEEY